MFTQRSQFLNAFRRLFPCIGESTVQKCWREIKDMPEPHLGIFINATLALSALKQEEAREVESEIRDAIGRAEDS